MLRPTSHQREADTQYTTAGESERAEAERKEADFLTTFLPQQKTEAEIDALLQKLITDQPEPLPAEPTKAQTGRFTGTIIKAFRESVDINTVEMDVVAKRLQAILAQKNSS